MPGANGMQHFACPCTCTFHVDEEMFLRSGRTSTAIPPLVAPGALRRPLTSPGVYPAKPPKDKRMLTKRQVKPRIAWHAEIHAAQMLFSAVSFRQRATVHTTG